MMANWFVIFHRCVGVCLWQSFDAGERWNSELGCTYSIPGPQTSARDFETGCFEVVLVCVGGMGGGGGGGLELARACPVHTSW